MAGANPLNLDLNEIGNRIDAASDDQNEAELKRLIEDCKAALTNATDAVRVDLHYFVANAHSALAIKAAETEGPWSWKSHHEIQEALALRRAIAEPHYGDTNIVRRSQIHTNLGNKLSTLGRSVEAVAEFSKALVLMPRFAKSLGNRGSAIEAYGYYLYDTGHQCLLLKQAMQDFRHATQPEAFWDSGFDPKAAEIFARKFSVAKAYLDAVEFQYDFDTNQFELGDSREEIEYRRWCLANRLFLNPLNDVMIDTVAATDVLHLPSHSYTWDEEARFPALYNVLKQEFVSARYRFYTSKLPDQPHFSDREVLLMDELDYSMFDIHTEDMKLAFRSVYSIFDKVALFLNDYFKVGLAEKKVSFREIWEKQAKGGAFELRPAFVGSKNLPLRGLYFLAKDFFDENFIEVASPEAKDIAEIRNFAEHRFLTLTEFGAPQAANQSHRRIPRSEFERKTLHLIKMARAALIYLSLAMKREEEIRAEEDKDKPNKISLPIFSMPLERDFKC